MKLKPLHSLGTLCAIGALSTPFAIAEEHGAAMDADHAAMKSEHKLDKLVAVIRPVGDSNVMGTVVFERVAGGIKVTAQVGGFEPGSMHAIHVHEFGDLASDDASSAGGHFNPEGHDHGLPDQDKRHAGDLGQMKADSNGATDYEVTVKNISIDPGPHCILGRAVIIHEKGDDGGQPTGNAGSRIGAGVIGISKDAISDDSDEEASNKDMPEADPQEISATEPDASSSEGVLGQNGVNR